MNRFRPLARPGIAAVWLAALVVSTACHNVHFEPRKEDGSISIYDDLFAVASPSADKIVAVGYWGAIYVSDDGGTTWAKADSGSKSLLYGVSMADVERGWAVGQSGTILHTTDGGKTWVRQKNLKEDEGSHLFSVHAYSANDVWAVGEWGSRIVTHDGGVSWEDESLTINADHPQFVWLAPPDQERVRNGEKVYEDVGINSVTCRPAPSTRCWATGEFGYVFWSEDRGATWHRGEIVGGLKVDPIQLDYNTLEMNDEDAARLKAFGAAIVDQGHLNVEIDPVANRAEIAAFGREDDPTDLFELLEARAQEVKAVLADAGILQDRIRLQGSPPWDYEDFLEDDPDFLKRYLAGRTHDFPGILIRVVQNPYLFTVRFADDDNGLIAGLGGVVLRSQDGGRSWSYEQTDRKQALFAIGTAPSRAFAIGEKGLVRVSTDGGRSWAEPKSGFPTLFTFMRDISFSPDSRVGVIVGQRGMVLRSQDQGQTWAQTLPPEVVTGGLF
jgi:photosystem II stability/assembly factor-like uncharacterized protein